MTSPLLMLFRKNGVAAAPASDYLDGVISSTCCDLDATIGDSYTSGQTWANLVAAPADGAGQTDYDFWLGADGTATTDDPTFTGTAGDSAAYFDVSTEDYFDIKSNTGTIFNDMHKTTGGTPWWVALTFNLATGSWGNMFATSNATSVGKAGFNCTVKTLSGDNVLELVQRADGTSRICFTDVAAGLNDAGNNIIIISFDGTDSWRWWVNSATASTTTQALNTVTIDANAPLSVFSGGTDFRGSLGGREYGFAAGNSFIDNTDAAAIITHLNTRHGRTYA